MGVLVAKRYVCAHRIPRLTAISSTFVSAKPHAHIRRTKKKKLGNIVFVTTCIINNVPI
jgi:hypothetical protein